MSRNYFDFKTAEAPAPKEEPKKIAEPELEEDLGYLYGN
jgi:hypothetical protein